MMKLLRCFLLLGALMAIGVKPVSLAESHLPLKPASSALRPVSGSLKVGYATNYEFRGLIPAGCNPSSPLRLDWRSDLNDTYSLILALKEEILLGHPAADLDNETVLDLGIQRKWGEASYTALSFRANDGGLAGLAAERLFSNGSTTYESALIVRHNLGGSRSFYVQGSAAYSFYGITGWWFDLCLGSDSRVTEHLYMRFQFGSVLSSSYWPGSANGWQSLFFRVTADYQIYKNIFLEPFVAIHWLGHGAHSVNRVYGRTLLKGNSWVTGVSLVYTF